MPWEIEYANHFYMHIYVGKTPALLASQQSLPINMHVTQNAHRWVISILNALGSFSSKSLGLQYAINCARLDAHFILTKIPTLWKKLHFVYKSIFLYFGKNSDSS